VRPWSEMPSVTVEGRGITIRQAIQDMWSRVRPLEDRGYRVVSLVEILDAQTRVVIETFEVTDPAFDLHLHSDMQNLPNEEERPIKYSYLARIQMRG